MVNNNIPVQIDPEVQMLKNNKEDGYRFRERRQEDWRENYELARDKVTINRLLQRQSVNIPLMKTIVRTLLKDVDDMPVLYFENLDNDKTSEVFQNEYWKWTVEQNNMEIQDIIDKKQVFYFGRTFDQWQIEDGKIKMQVQDPEDMLVSRYTDPSNIHSSRFLIHDHIFVPLSYLENNLMYDQFEIAKLKEFYATEMGLIKAQDNFNSLEEKNKKMADMGVADVHNPVLGETYVELSLQFVFRDRETQKGKNYSDQIFMYVVADDFRIIFKNPLEKVIGETKDGFFKNHYNYITWGDDVEKQDFWNDAVADMIRTPNKILNSFFSQMVENRTLRNYGMNYYNSSLEGFSPNTFNPIPWGWYGIPIGAQGRMSDAIQKVEVPDLSESLDEMNFIITMCERGSGATATQQGAQTERKITLGEVELALSEAKERIKGMSKFYTTAWKERGLMFLKLIEAGSDKIDAVKIFKKGRNNDEIYSKEIGPKDWMTEQGYRTKIWSQDEKKASNTDSLEKISAVKMNMPDNPKVTEIYQRKLCEFADFSPEETNEVMEYEKEKTNMLLSQNMNGGMGTPGAGMANGQANPPLPPPVMPNKTI
jgi:hypothetical protein